MRRPAHKRLAGRPPTLKKCPQQSSLVKKIIADTNFLLSQFEYGIDLPFELQRVVGEPFQLVLFTGVLRELSTLAGRNGKRAAAARFVVNNLPKLRMLFNIVEEQSDGKVDEWIIKYARKNTISVATNDLLLRRRLLGMEVPVIAMKGKSKLDYV